MRVFPVRHDADGAVRCSGAWAKARFLNVALAAAFALLLLLPADGDPTDSEIAPRGRQPGLSALAPALDCKPHSFPQRTQRSLAVDPSDDRKLYIGVEQEGFFKSTDGGATWQRASNGIKAWNRLDGSGLCYEEFYSTVIDPKNPDRICISMAGSPGTIGLRTSAANNGVYCSSDAGETWTQMVSPTMNTAVYALVADPRDF